MIHIACGANTAYLAYVATMLHSLLTQPRDRQITIHFMHGEELADVDEGRLAQMVVRLGGHWRSHLIGDKALAQFPPNGRFGREAWFRVLLPQILPDVSRVLYLDADTLVLRPIEPLWRTELGDCLAGAVYNPMYPFLDDGFMQDLGVRPENYFNSGVLLLDLERWRAQNITQRVQRFVTEHAESQNWPDQNALNTILGGGRCLMLDPVWNAQNVFFDLRAGQIPLGRDKLSEIRTRPGIVHFIAPYKPLDYLCKHPYRRVYLEHLAATPWAGVAMNGKTLANRLLRLLPQPFMWVFILVRLPRFKRKLLRMLQRSN